MYNISTVVFKFQR